MYIATENNSVIIAKCTVVREGHVGGDRNTGREERKGEGGRERGK